MDLLFIAGLIALATGGRLDGAAPPPEALWALVSAAALCWLMLRRSAQTWILVGFWVLSYSALLFFEPTLMMVAVLVVFVRSGVQVGLRSVLIALGPIEAGWLVAHLFDPGRGWLLTAFWMVYTVGYLAVPVVLGVALSWLQTAVTDLAAANSGLEVANQDLAKQSLLAQDLLLTQERSRAARELHDSLGNQLTIVGAQLDRVRELAEDDLGRAQTELTGARAEIGAALRDVRIWVRAMNPPNRSSGVGLAGLNDVAASFRGTGLAVEVRVPDGQLDVGQRRNLYVTRFVQEGLTNSLRHGRAHRVWVRAQVNGPQLNLELRDDGQGAVGVPVEGFGLRSLRERAIELGGSFESSGLPGGGFGIKAVLPLVEATAFAPVGAAGLGRGSVE